MRAKAAVFLGVFEEGDDLVQLFLGLVDAGHVVEGDLGVGLDIDLGLALADRHEAAAHPLATRHAPHQEYPQAEEQQRRHHPGQDVGEERALHLA